ncbi:MAG: hypothetical protein K0R38_5013 [Polyangiaceae bacterium]|nr:hypothetical protein [Polyangiaceae bacterium]
MRKLRSRSRRDGEMGEGSIQRKQQFALMVATARNGSGNAQGGLASSPGFVERAP